MRLGGFVNVQSLLGHPYIVERESSEQDVGGIVDGLGGNTKYRFEIGNPHGGKTHMVRATQGHSANLGVNADALPIDEDVLYVTHGKSLQAELAIVLGGLNRGERLRVHFHERALNGHLVGDISMRRRAEAVIEASASQAREEGIVPHRSTNDVVLFDGIGGIIPPSFNRYVLAYPQPTRPLGSQVT